VRFLSQGERTRDRILFVQDVATGDQYTSTLATGFRDRIPAGRLVSPEPALFDSSRPGLADTFRTQMTALCAKRPDVVYFAGRGTSLPPYLTALAHRPCRDRRLTVMTGDDAVMVTQTAGFGVHELSTALRTGGIDLVYTGLAHPGAWTVAPRAFDPEAVAPFRDGTFTNAFPHEDLEDGRAIMMYDAVLTAVRAIRSIPAAADHTAADVYRTLSSLRHEKALPGASGWIAIGDDGGPHNKAIPIIRMDPAGGTTAIAVSSADGTPYIPAQT
jgi:ABC-type branched-subunit amino acid transport system substrate-binding protein